MTDTVTIESGSVEFLTKNDFDSIITERQSIHDEIKDLKESLKSCNEEIEAVMIAAGVENKRVQTPFHMVAIIASSSSRIDGHKLLEHGVDPGVIAAATVKKEYTYVKVSEVN